MPDIDETSVSVGQLSRLLPESVLPDMAKNLIGDISQAPPAFFMAGGDSLYRHGNVTIMLGSSSGDSVSVDVDTEFGKEVVNEVVGWDMHSELVAKAEVVGLSEEEIIEKVGLFILSNVNGDSDMHGFAIGLFEQIGSRAFYREEGTMGNGEIDGYVDGIIDNHIKEEKDIKRKYYYRGILRHLQTLLKSDKIADIKKAIEIFNEAVDGDDEIRVYDDVEMDISEGVIEKVVEYLTNPITYFRDNPEIKINLAEYENRYGQLPRQPDLPGLNNV